MHVISFGGKLPGANQAKNAAQTVAKKALPQTGLQKPLAHDTLSLSKKAKPPLKK